MGNGKKLLKIALTYVVAFSYAIVIFGKVFFSVLKNPRNVFKVKERPIPSSILTSFDGTHGYVTLKNKIKLHYVSTGKKGSPLLLCLHGFPEFWYSWKHQLQALSSDFYVVALDMPGYAGSDRLNSVDDYAIDNILLLIKETIEALGYNNCNLMGHDWGGAITWRFLISYPQMVTKSVVLNIPHTSAFAEFLSQSWKQFLMSTYIFFFQLPYIPELFLSLDDLSFFEDAFNKPPGGLNFSKLSSEEIEAFKYAASLSGGLTGGLNYYRANFGKHLTKSQVSVPTLLIFGDGDAFLSPEMAELSKKYCDDLKVEYIPGASHWVQQDAPDKVNSLISGFLSSKK